MRAVCNFCCVVAALLIPLGGGAQEASSGFEMPITLTGGAFYTHRTGREAQATGPLQGGLRAVAYPTLRLNRNWRLSGAVQVHSRPYFYEQFGTQQEGLKSDVLQAYVGYERFWGSNFFSFKAGQLSSAFGSFLLRYDDAVNPLVDMPLSYGYYYKSVTNLGLTGAQINVTLNKFDFRVQAASSSPTNRRSLFDRDQYLNWAAGTGYTIAQGFRVGISAYRGPYLHRGHRFFFPGERSPKDLPASGYGIDVEFARGHWNFYGEVQRFQHAYTVFPTYNQRVGYGEIKYSLHPRWYVAARAGREQANLTPTRAVYEFGLGYRPARRQLVKASYHVVQGPRVRGTLDNVFALQLVTRFDQLSAAFD